MKIFCSDSENFQKCSVCPRFDFSSCLTSEDESLHRLSKRQQKILHCYHTNGANL